MRSAFYRCMQILTIAVSAHACAIAEEHVTKEVPSSRPAKVTINADVTLGEVLRAIADADQVPIVGSIEPDRLNQRAQPGTYEIDQLLPILAEAHQCTLYKTPVGYLLNSKRPPTLQHLGRQVTQALWEWQSLVSFLSSLTHAQVTQMTRGVVPFIPLAGDDTQPQLPFARKILAAVSPIDAAAGVPLFDGRPVEALSAEDLQFNITFTGRFVIRDGSGGIHHVDLFKLPKASKQDAK